MEDEDWEESLLWCPTQITRVVYFKGIEFKLYLRWRHVDPFQFHIFCDIKNIEKALNLGFINDIFEKRSLYYADNDYKKAEDEAYEIWKKIKIEIHKTMNEQPELFI